MSEQICSYCDVGRPVYHKATGMCRGCYDHARRDEKQAAQRRRSLTPEEKAKVNTENGRKHAHKQREERAFIEHPPKRGRIDVAALDTGAVRRSVDRLLRRVAGGY